MKEVVKQNKQLLVFYAPVQTDCLHNIELVVQVVEDGVVTVEKRGVIFEPNFGTKNERLNKEINAWLENMTKKIGVFSECDEEAIEDILSSDSSLEEKVQNVWDYMSDVRDFESEFEDLIDVKITIEEADDEDCARRYATIRPLGKEIEITFQREKNYEKKSIVDTIAIEFNGETVFEKSAIRKTFKKISELEDASLYDDDVWAPWERDCDYDLHPVVEWSDYGEIECTPEEMVERFVKRATKFLN